MLLLRYGRAVVRNLSRTTVKVVLLLALLITLLQEAGGQSIIRPPEDQSVIVGGRAKFFCVIENRGNANILWNKGTSTIFFNGVRDESSVDARYRIEEENNLVIDNVVLGDEALYSCSIFGSDRVEVKLTVWLPPGPPVIETNSTRELVENSVIYFTCSSSGGKPAPTIRWLRNGQLINSAIETPPSSEMGTSSSQIILTVTKHDHSANYSCEVYNNANQNSRFESSRTLNVQYSPSIHFQPNYSPYIVELNTPVTLKCVVDSNPPYQQLQWRRNGVPLPISSDTLPFDAIQKNNAGEYTCTATNSVQNQVKHASSSVTIDVIYAPVVTTQPIIVADISTQVNMTCLVDANPQTTSVRWEKIDGDSINGNGPNFVFYAEKRYIGNYSCTARNLLQPSGQGDKHVTSKGYTTLRINYAPGQASIHPTPSVLVGQAVQLTCTVDDQGYPSPQFEWRKAGSSQLLQSSRSPVYRISSATLDDNGNYTCLPTNQIGSGSPATILVEVNFAPVFVQSAPDTDLFTVPLNLSTLMLEHKIEGRPLPTVQWFKDGVPLSVMPKLFKLETTNSLVDQYKYRVTSKLLFVGPDRHQNALRIVDMGNFTCQVTSSASTDTVSKSVYLSIQFAPQASSYFRVAAELSKKAKITCSAQSNPPPLFYWSKQGQQLTNSSRITITHLPVGGIAMYDSYLEIEQAISSDLGEYTCQIMNEKGQTQKKVILSPIDKPDPPMNLASIGKTWESVNLRWDAGFNGGYDQTFFVHVSSIYGQKHVEVYPRASSTYNVTRLMPQTSYTFHVYGRNQEGKGNNSLGFTAQTNVLVFPPLKEIPEYHVENNLLNIPNDLNESYCLRVEVSKDGGKIWTTAESCATPLEKSVGLSLGTTTNVNVSVCLVYRPEVCGEPVVSKIYQPATNDLPEEAVIAIGCVCAGILVILLIVLIVVLCKRRQRSKNYQSDPHSPRTIQQGNGVIPQKQPQPRAYDNTDGIQVDNRNGYPSHFQFNVDTSYDSNNFDNQFEYEMNRRNANLNGDPYLDKQGDMSFNEPRTPTKDPLQFINLPEENHKREGGSVGSGNESGYSTPDPAKPKKHWTLKPYLQTLTRPILPKPHNKTQTNPDMVPYSHNPPGHTCGLPCCNEELQIQLRVRRPKSCIGFQQVDEVLQDNFTFRRNKLLKDRPTLENGFFSVQQSKETQRAAIPKFASLSKGMTKPKDDLGRRNFLKGREISLPEATDPDATNKLYLEDFYTGESDDLLDVTSDKDIEYYMSMKASNGAEKGVPYSQKDLQEKDMCPWELMLELKTKTSQSEKTDDTTSSNYYEVLHYNDSIQSSSETDKSSEGPSLPVKRIKKFPIAKPLPEVPPKVPLQNLFNHPPLRKKSELDKTTSQSCDNVMNKSFDLDKGTKYNTYSSLHSVNREKRKLENQEKQKYMSLGRSSVTKKWRKDAREIDFQIPKRAFKGVRSPKLEAKRRKMYGKTEKENQHFNIMLNSELLKLKKFFQDDDDTETDESTKGQTNDGYVTDNSDEVFHTDKSGGMDNPVTLIL